MDFLFCNSNQLNTKVFSLQAKTEVSLFATSKFIPDIVQQFEGSVSLEVRESSEDVQTYLNGRTSNLPAFVLRSPDLQEEIKTEIRSAVDEMYMPSHIIRD